MGLRVKASHESGAEIDDYVTVTGETSDIDVPHVVLRPDGFGCLHCGIQYTMRMPCSIGVLVAASNGFISDHESCAQSERGDAVLRYTTPDEWLASWDTGTSSEALYWYMRSGEIPTCIPRDSDDVGRCIRLMAVAPVTWSIRLEDLATDAPAWAEVVARWAELVTAHDTEDYDSMDRIMKEINR